MNGYTRVPRWVAAVVLAVVVALIVLVAVPAAEHAQTHESNWSDCIASGHAPRCH